MPPMAEPVLVEAEELGRDFEVSRPWLERKLGNLPRQWLRAVDDVTFRIERGRTLALVGESGCGKSTVARLMVGLHAPSNGRVTFDGVDLAEAAGAELQGIRRRMQMVFQDPYASVNPRWRVRDIVAEPLRAHRLVTERGALRDRVSELLTQVGLAPRDGDRYPHEFSGGQRQRISIARALASKPEFLVCDEPTSALDVSVQAQVLNLLQELQAQFGLTCLFISHNLAVVEYVASDVGVMYLGRLVEIGPVDAVLTRPAHPYARMLLDALPDLEMTGRPRTPVAGEVPNPLEPPSGCAFHPRCPHANARCAAERPVLKAAAGGLQVACHAVEEGRIGSGSHAVRPAHG
jgi:peptide/nickel transport system ATP-binding protein